MNFNWVVLAVTYVVCQVFTFVECRPLYLYWQVVPDPGTLTLTGLIVELVLNKIAGDCPRAPLQLIVYVSLNIFTDVLLIILPMPWLVNMKRSIKE
jgi:hypothetical protein